MGNEENAEWYYDIIVFSPEHFRRSRKQAEYSDLEIIDRDLAYEFQRSKRAKRKHDTGSRSGDGFVFIDFDLLFTPASYYARHSVTV